MKNLQWSAVHVKELTLQNRRIRRHYTTHNTSAVSTSLASSMPVNHLQVGYDHLQMPSWSGAVLLG